MEKVGWGNSYYEEAEGYVMCKAHPKGKKARDPTLSTSVRLVLDKKIEGREPHRTPESGAKYLHGTLTTPLHHLPH